MVHMNLRKSIGAPSETGFNHRYTRINSSQECVQKVHPLWRRNELKGKPFGGTPDFYAFAFKCLLTKMTFTPGYMYAYIYIYIHIYIYICIYTSFV